jgi:P4 family phage/plasmid primase-like protien
MNPTYAKPAQESDDLLSDVTIQFGPPYRFIRADRPILNELFWAGLYATENNVLHEAWVKDFYQFNCRIYEQIENAEIIHWLARRMIRAADEWPEYEHLSAMGTARNLHGVLTQLQGHVLKRGAFDSERNFIILENGVLILKDGQERLEKFDPSFISRNLIPVRYDRDASCKRFQNELLAPIDKDDRALLQKMAGMFLSGINSLQKILILEGEPDSGKSQLAIVFKETIGKANCSELRTKQLDGRFEIGGYLGKTLLIGADVSAGFLNESAAYRLKALTGGDLLMGERKNANQRMSLAGIFNILITSNARQKVNLESDRGAWGRRLLMVHYDQSKRAKSIPNFGQFLVREEGSGILNWCIQGYHNLKSEVEIHGGLKLTPAQRQRIEQLLDESDSLRIFLTRQLQTKAESTLTTDEIVSRYSVWCTHRGYSISIGQIERQLPDVIFELFGCRKVNDIERDGKAKRGYRHLAFRPENNDDPSS